ncbi:MAG: glycosyltransferase [Candidatus Aenigmatarchaeota archaeon]
MALNREGTKSTEKIILKPIIKKIYKLEKSYLSNMDLIVANSKYTKNIYNNFFNLDVEYIVYPPVNTEKFHFKSIGDFYLYVGRLYLCKRVDVIIRAFMKLRNEKLVIVGEGPLREYIIKVTQKYKNISYLGAVSEKVLKELYANANSVIYIPEKEHFGLVPVESNASGKSAIVSNEGGLKEIINKKEVGLRINKPYLKNLVKVIKRKEHLDYWDKKECIRNAKRFDERNFIKQMKKIFEEVNKK